MLAVLIRRRGTPGPRVPQATQPSQNRRPDPEGLRQHLLNDPAAQEHLRQRKPELLAALNDPVRWREVFTMEQRREEQAERERQEQINLLNDDPFNVEAQRKIEEIIRQDRVVENLHHAYEHNPEVFVQVHMLYVNTEVNGTPVKAFVDSGAQATIMSPDCAQRCGIMRLLDTRYAGIAKGVGTAKILGRVHHAEIKIGSAVLPCAFTVMEGKDVDLLFGLDMLKRYKAKIDLEKNALCFEGIEVPFLHESDIPRNFEEAQTKEPTVSGPNGTKIGGRTGQVYTDETAQAGPSSAQSSQPPQPSQPAQSQKAPVDDPPQSASTDSFPQENIDQLVNLGFSRQAAIQALQATGGNVEFAAGLLFDGN